MTHSESVVNLLWLPRTGLDWRTIRRITNFPGLRNDERSEEIGERMDASSRRGRAQHDAIPVAENRPQIVRILGIVS